MHHSLYISRWIHSMRTGRKLSRRTVAESLGIAPNYLYMLEVGLKVPSIKLTLQIGNYFGVNPEWLKEIWVRDFVSVIEARIREHIEHIHLVPHNSISRQEVSSLPSPIIPSVLP